MRRRAFSLVELLVVITIILVLMALTGAGVSAARNSQRVQATRELIAKLNAIVSQQYASYASLELPGVPPTSRPLELRRRVTRDMPDRWVDVKQVAANASALSSRHQRSYFAVWNSLNPPPANNAFDSHPNRDKYAGAECLFMIVMRGGIANCLDCTDLAAEPIGDKDGDGAFEFQDAWGNPIGYILWPGGLELPADTGTKFFSQTAPFGPTATGAGLRPLIYSAGPDGVDTASPDGQFGFRCDFGTSNLQSAQCGDPAAAPVSDFAKPLTGASDNITNFDAEAKR